MKKFLSKKGYTLIELMIAVTIFAVVSLFVVDVFLETSKRYYNSLSSRAAQQNIKFSMETITRYVKQSTIANWDPSTRTLRLKVKEAGGLISDVVIAWDLPVYGMDGYPTQVGRLRMGINTPSPTQYLTSNDANITNFSISHIVGIPPMVKISLRAKIVDTSIQALERGISSDAAVDDLKLDTTVALKAQYNSY